MEILNVISTLNPASGGPATVIPLLHEGLSALGHTSHTVCLDAPGSRYLQRLKYPFDAVGPSRFSYGYASQLRQYLDAAAVKFDAMIVHGLWQHHGFVTRRAARRGGVPYFVFTHGMLDPWFKRRYPLKHLKKWLYWPWGEYRVLRDAAGVFFTCQEECRLARQSFWLYGANEVVTGLGTLDPARVAPVNASTFHQKFPGLSDRRILLFLGRLHPKKNLETLIASFGRLAREHPHLLLVIAGQAGGPGVTMSYEGDLQRLAQQCAPAGSVKFIGMVEGLEKWSVIHASEALVLPSHQENFGLVVAEALACGRPALISQGVNIWKEVVDEGAGLSAPASREGVESLLAGWLQLSGEGRKARGRSARACFEKHFSVSGVAKRVAAAVRSHLSSKVFESDRSLPVSHGK